jgi:gamma-glutamyltranspeptidase / glutathione hydrolase
MKHSGAIACGHAETARAAEHILREGGNAFDAVIAAFLSACVAEPVLASLGGGGFLLAHTHDRGDVIYDFFAQTPQAPLPEDSLDFYPIHADFGATKQEFHIGLASIATPGAIKGIFKIHRDLGSMPMRELAAPAIEAARNGVVVSAFQAYILGVVSPILTATAESKYQFRSHADPEVLIGEGELLRQSQFADFLDALVYEGDGLFYHGEVAHSISRLCADGGGQLTRQDLADYRVVLREPARVRYRQHQVLTNPAPSCGGTLIAFALNLLEHAKIHRFEFGSHDHLRLLAETMRLTNEARFEIRSHDVDDRGLDKLLDAVLLDQYCDRIAGNPRSLRGTTHVSVMDGNGNVASLTASNGEGCGHIIRDTGVMLNNMLGEQDLNPDGFYNWPADRRMTSMMAPTLVFSPSGAKVCLGSGGSNRLRTAILQVLVNIIDYDMPLDIAVNSPRLHFEDDLLSIEPGFEQHHLQPLLSSFSNHHLWERNNLFFGGVHAVGEHRGEFTCAGDLRRDGVAVVLI